MSAHKLLMSQGLAQLSRFIMSLERAQSNNLKDIMRTQAQIAVNMMDQPENRNKKTVLLAFLLTVVASTAAEAGGSVSREIEKNTMGNTSLPDDLKNQVKTELFNKFNEVGLSFADDARAVGARSAFARPASVPLPQQYRGCSSPLCAAASSSRSPSGFEYVAHQGPSHNAAASSSSAARVRPQAFSDLSMLAEAAASRAESGKRSRSGEGKAKKREKTKRRRIRRRRR